MVKHRTIFVSNDEDELELIAVNNKIRIYITPDGDDMDYMRHASIDIDTEDIDELVEELLLLKNYILQNPTKSERADMLADAINNLKK